MRHGLCAVAPRNDRPIGETRLDRGQFFKLGHILLHQFIGVCGDVGVVAIFARVVLADTAIILVSQTHQGFRIGYRQTLEENGVYQVKMAAWVPIQSASVSSTVMVNPGVLRNWRSA